MPQKLYAVALNTGEKRLLAAREGSRPFIFDQSVFNWMDEYLRNALKYNVSPLLVDEVGPLEILEGKGLWAPLDILLKEYGQPIILSVRPSLLSPLADLLAARTGERHKFRVIDVAAIKEAKEAAENIAEEIFCHCQA
ncbi:MAG: hypothetical protein FD137_927 [Spirochaetes bacterium]|nr:MAG: hypothetical protein FD137_927 [Spirochaetota bacterium]